MEISPDRKVAQIAAHYPATIRVFQSHGIDFCCGGKRPLAEACAAHGVDVDALSEELTRAAAGPASDDRAWDEAPLGELARHIVDHYHGKLREELPRLGYMAEKVLRVHGERHPEMLPPLASTFQGLRAELESHMIKEEQILFPAIVQMEHAAGNGGPGPLVGALDGPIDVMEHEHDDAARALARLRELTGGFQPPAGACNTFRGLFHGLEELEGDLHRHIHLENNVLFPRAQALEEELAARSA